MALNAQLMTSFVHSAAAMSSITAQGTPALRERLRDRIAPRSRVAAKRRPAFRAEHEVASSRVPHDPAPLMEVPT